MSNTSPSPVITFITPSLILEMVRVYHSVFRSLCSVPVFRSFHVPCSCVLVCIFIRPLGVLVKLLLFSLEYLQTFLGISDTGILPDTGAICHDSMTILNIPVPLVSTCVH